MIKSKKPLVAGNVNVQGWENEPMRYPGKGHAELGAGWSNTGGEANRATSPLTKRQEKGETDFGQNTF